MMKIEKRKEITRRYLQTVLWVDDEITFDGNPDGKFQTFFRPAGEAISKEGLICQLFPFCASKGPKDPYADESLETIRNLVERADLTIVDWHLGADDSSNAVEIVNKILSVEGTRFCVVLSQAPGLEQEFAAIFSEQAESKGQYWAGKNGKYFVLLNKNEFEAEGIPMLFERIISSIADTYNDYIHWIAIEIMANVRKKIPSLLACLPEDTDDALMAELVQSNLDETIEFAVTAVGEDIFDIVTEMPLDSVKTCSDQVRADERFEQFSQSYSNEAQMKSLDLAQAYRGEPSRFNHLCPSYNGLTKLLEHKSLAQSLARRVYQGAVFQERGDKKRIYICISQACDCYRKEYVLLLKGELDQKWRRIAPGRTNVFFGEANYTVLPNAESCVLARVEDYKATRKGIEKMDYVGGLRASVAMRIADRFFSHQTRVGVNQPTIIRELRQNS